MLSVGMLSIGTIRFEDRFCTSKKSRDWGSARFQHGRIALTINNSVMSGCGQGREPPREWLKEALILHYDLA